MAPSSRNRDMFAHKIRCAPIVGVITAEIRIPANGIMLFGPHMAKVALPTPAPVHRVAANVAPCTGSQRRSRVPGRSKTRPDADATVEGSLANSIMCIPHMTA